jgi:DNA-binding NarL/FixJ family response regulator
MAARVEAPLGLRDRLSEWGGSTRARPSAARRVRPAWNLAGREGWLWRQISRDGLCWPWWPAFTGYAGVGGPVHGGELAETLERDPSVSVVGLCTDLSEAVALSATLQAEIILLDARITDGTAALKRALEVAPGIRVVVSAVRETEDDVVAWAEAGAIGYIPRTTPLGDFVRLIVEIHSGEQMCSGRVAAGLLRRIAHTARRSNGRNGALKVPVLTKRERQTAELIKSGLSDKEIARRLNISVATTKSHVHNLLGKLNLRRRSQVVEYLRDTGPSRSTWLVSLLILATALAPIRVQRYRAEHTPPRLHALYRVIAANPTQPRRRPKPELTAIYARRTGAEWLLIRAAKGGAEGRPSSEQEGSRASRHFQTIL